MRGEPFEIVRGDPRLAMFLQQRGGFFFAQRLTYRVLVLGGLTGKQAWLDPFFQDQPAAEIHAMKFAGLRSGFRLCQRQAAIRQQRRAHQAGGFQKAAAM
jgi:hypothetical protein